MTEDENVLMKSLQIGEESAFDAIFKIFHSSLVFFSSRILAAQEIQIAEEIVQDVWLKFYERRRNFEYLNAVKAFLYISVKNKCLQQLEKNQVKNRRLESYFNQPEAVQESVLQDIIYSEVIREVTAAIELLPPQCRLIMKHFFEDGKNAKEIAELLQISVSTVNNQKSRAISVLKNKLSTTGFLFLFLHI